MPDIHALRRAAEYALQRREAEQNKPPAGDGRRRIAQGQDCRLEGTALLLHRQGGRPLEIRKDFSIITLRLSPQGLSFLANQELQAKDLVEVKLPAKCGGDKLLRVRVQETRRAGLNAFEIAAEFASES